MENRTTPPSTPSLARRYICKLLANVASVPVYLAMEAILPRALGPAMYGNYSFATNFFQQLFMAAGGCWLALELWGYCHE